MSEETPKYLIKSFLKLSSFQELLSKERFFNPRPSQYHNGIQRLFIFRNRTLLTIIPYKTFKENLTVLELLSFVSDLVILNSANSLDAHALANALKKGRNSSRKIIVHLPYFYPDFQILLKLNHPFIDMESFDKEDFINNRTWLRKQQKKWSDFQFLLFKFEFDRDKSFLFFYLENAGKRFNYSRSKLISHLKEIQSTPYPMHVAALKYQGRIAAIWFLRLDLKPNLFLLYPAFDCKLSKYSPGNALIFNLLCYLKETHVVSRVHFGPISCRNTSSYKLNWCDHFTDSYLYAI
jgi:hypothetical protein